MIFIFLKCNFPLIILSLIPLSYILKGGLPFDLTAIVYLILFIISFFKMTKGDSISFIQFDILVFIWSLIALSSILYTPLKLEGLFKFGKFFFLGVSLIYFCRLYIKNNEDMSKFFKYFLISSTITAFLVIIDFFSSNMEIGRYIAFGSVVPIPLSLLGATTTLMVIVMYSFKKINSRIFFLILIPGISMMTIAGSKGPVIAFILTLILISPALIKKIKIKQVITISLGVIILSKIDYISNSFNNLKDRFSNVNKDMSTEIRVDIYEKAYKSFEENIIFGLGIGGLDEYPHNIILEILAENGLIIFLIVFIFLIILLIKCIIIILNKESDYLEVMIVSLLFTSIITLMFSFTYVDHKYFFLSIGLLLTYKSEEKTNSMFNNTINKELK